MAPEINVEEFAESMNRFATVLLSKETVTSVLDLVVNLTEKTIAGADGVSVTMIRDGDYTTAAHSHEWVEAIDQLQYKNGDGPCISAAQERKLHRVDDLSLEDRWEAFCKEACVQGVRSVLSIPFIPLEEPIGALNIYSFTREAFDDVREQVASLLAQQAAIVLANSQAFAGASELNEQLRTALGSRDVIGQAKGIIMEREGVDADAAFNILKAMSQRSNRKLRDIAQDVANSAGKGVTT
jgi:GAF domain-containing protein